MKKIKIYFPILLFSFLLLVNFVLANTAPSTGGGGCGGPDQIPNPLGCSTTDIPTLIDQIVNFLLLIISPIATIMVLYAALLFMTSGGSVEKVSMAKATLTWAVIGIVILLVAKGITSIIASILEQ